VLPKVIFASLQVLDGLSTHKALSLGAEEKNPLVRNAIDLVGEVPALVIVKTMSAFGTLGLLRGVPYANTILWGLNLFYAGVLLKNLKSIKEANHA
jgi:hypothetical protein